MMSRAVAIGHGVSLGVYRSAPKDECRSYGMLRRIFNGDSSRWLGNTITLIGEIELLRSEVSRLSKELEEHRAIVKHKQDFIMGEPRGVYKP